MIGLGPRAPGDLGVATSNRPCPGSVVGSLRLWENALAYCLAEPRSISRLLGNLRPLLLPVFLWKPPAFHATTLIG